jgi:hypothetical protein
LKEDLEWRKSEVEQTGFGFSLPTVNSSVRLLGLPSAKEKQTVKAA